MWSDVDLARDEGLLVGFAHDHDRVATRDPNAASACVGEVGSDRPTTPHMRLESELQAEGQNPRPPSNDDYRQSYDGRYATASNRI